MKGGEHSMYQDMHAHTWYSACGRDDPRVLIDTVHRAGIHQLGICDHNYGIGDRLNSYIDEMMAYKEQYHGIIDIRAGIEISSLPDRFLPPDADIHKLDYALIEFIDNPDSCVGTNLIPFAERCNTALGIAHTDLFGLIKERHIDARKFLAGLVSHRIFWELNVNLDSIHHHREYGYVHRFLRDQEQQDIVRETGLRVSVGFDSHDVSEYKPDRIKQTCLALQKARICMPFQEACSGRL